MLEDNSLLYALCLYRRVVVGPDYSRQKVQYKWVSSMDRELERKYRKELERLL